MTNKKDDLDAVRDIAKLLKNFEPQERDRIIRWVRERLGEPTTPPVSSTAPQQKPNTNNMQASRTYTNIKSFIDDKNPKNAVQLATTIAYYYAFEAPENEKKDSIEQNDLIEGIRRSSRTRPTNPSQVLNNAKTLGLLDSAEERGHFKINNVGENLVAMVLPGNSDKNSKFLKKKKTKKAQKRKKKSRRK